MKIQLDHWDLVALGEACQMLRNLSSSREKTRADILEVLKDKRKRCQLADAREFIWKVLCRVDVSVEVQSEKTEQE